MSPHPATGRYVTFRYQYCWVQTLSFPGLYRSTYHHLRHRFRITRAQHGPPKVIPPFPQGSQQGQSGKPATRHQQVGIRVTRTTQAVTYSATSYDLQNSPLLALPAELRNKIYKHFMSSTTYTFTHFGMGEEISSDAKRARRGPDLQRIDLLLTCRQMYAEVVGFSLSLATFQFSLYYALTQAKCIPMNICVQIEKVVVTRERDSYTFDDFLEHTKIKKLELRDMLPAVKVVELDIYIYIGYVRVDAQVVSLEACTELEGLSQVVGS